MPPRRPRLRIIIVNYKTPDLTIRCLESLARERETLRDPIDVVVVDNRSEDGSEERIRDAIRARFANFASLIASPENGGFAYGNNLGIRPALESASPPDYFMLLNPDTEALPGCLERLLGFMDATPSAGIAGTRIESGNGVVQHSAFRFPSVAGELERGMSLGVLSKLLERWVEAPPIRTETHQTDWVSGAAMIIRREVLESIGLMDEAYFLYYEEVDFCLRAHRAGWSCWYVPEAGVIHRAGASTGVSHDDEHEAKRKRLPRYWFESRRRYFEKNFGQRYAGLADLAYGAGFGLWRLRTKIQRKPDRQPPKVLEDLVRVSVDRLTKRK
jgi:GT2 family glycosyltransferase